MMMVQKARSKSISTKSLHAEAKDVGFDESNSIGFSMNDSCRLLARMKILLKRMEILLQFVLFLIEYKYKMYILVLKQYWGCCVGTISTI
jgi:hypothetical protein